MVFVGVIWGYIGVNIGVIGGNMGLMHHGSIGVIQGSYFSEILFLVPDARCLLYSDRQLLPLELLLDLFWSVSYFL